MTDESMKPESGAGEQAFWEEPAAAPAQGREWLTQLQQMIDRLTTQAGPVVREVGAKAAELAALAGEKAGPVAHRAAEFTTEAGMKVAERSRDIAAEIRRDQAARGERPGSGSATGEPGSDAAASEEPTTTSVG